MSPNSITPSASVVDDLLERCGSTLGTEINKNVATHQQSEIDLENEVAALFDDATFAFDNEESLEAFPLTQWKEEAHTIFTRGRNESLRNNAKYGPNDAGGKRLRLVGVDGMRVVKSELNVIVNLSHTRY